MDGALVDSSGDLRVLPQLRRAKNGKGVADFRSGTTCSIMIMKTLSAEPSEFGWKLASFSVDLLNWSGICSLREATN